jgi:sialidase-1
MISRQLAMAALVFSTSFQLEAAPTTVPAKPLALAADVFVAGQEGYHTFRIPSLLVTAKGTLLAFAEGRKNGRADSGDIDLVLKRSNDAGRTWSALQVVASDAANTVGNPCPVVDGETGTIWLPMTWNLGQDLERDIIAGTSKDTRRVMVSSSNDDGVSWSKRVDVTATTKLPEWTWYATGPGVGIQLKSGRLLIPCDHREVGSSKYRSHVIYSDDHGKSWKLGGVVGEDVNECQAVELSDESIMINMRSYRANRRCRAMSISKDGGASWSGLVDDATLIEPNCQASLVGFAGDARHKPFVLFCNPASQQKREKLTVRVSHDEGRTWPIAKLIDEGPSAYSSLAVLPDVTVGCLYERDNYGKITFVRLTVDAP